ncbi:MAG: transcription elongation factor GreA [Deltaproteobacteria bacterium CG11_big_fil_rev_8_21_14_0_20_49_13]|nr:MAG: transcription elongation factor GreA [Deltaproteobacteria bacterium CG11_big_fil_rev_8_21_14_0_20_49_13]
MQKMPMTPDGYKKLQEKLKHLKGVERPKNVKAIEEARGHGDLSENADYAAAKEHQAHLSRQMQEIEHAIASAQVIDPAKIESEKVVFGATVKLHDIDNGEEVKYMIVGAYESDISKGKISIESPIARAMIGKFEGDEVKVRAPSGMRTYEILEISFS